MNDRRRLLLLVLFASPFAALGWQICLAAMVALSPVIPAVGRGLCALAGRVRGRGAVDEGSDEESAPETT